jgi:DNA-binding transcriptional regulator YdaS (Cro superfamily)
VLAGGASALAADLGVDPGMLDAWLTGAAAVPEDVFDKALDIVLAPEPKAWLRLH